MKQSQHQIPHVDSALHTYELMLPRQPPDYDQSAVQQLQREQFAYLIAQRVTGCLLAADAAPGHGLLTFLDFFRTGDKEPRAIVEEDPAVKTGIDEYGIVTFVCPKGALAFPK